jgi:2-polyprenyl-6-methoxyphenol hydroxylase-like FAD-dependent oxidoreductase
MEQQVACCIAGCGPAGAMLGLLLARAGVNVLVLEKHSDFLRDFRGDTIHPSTLEVLLELGLAERFLKLPHTEVRAMTLRLGDNQVVNIEYGTDRDKFPFIAFVPQWDFLEFITAEAQRYPSFQLVRNAEVIDLIQSGDHIRGLKYRDATGEHWVMAKLTVGADGRESRTREAAGLPLIETAPPMDVEWFRLSRRQSDGEGAWLRPSRGRIVVVFTRGEYWQIAYLIPKGTDEQLRNAGLETLQRAIAELEPMFSDRVKNEIDDWDKVKLLTVRADRLRRWYRPGYLAIGDAAHAMSPVAGVGINMAIQDAVAAANLLWRPLLSGEPTVDTLKRVQRQRELTIRVIQGIQAAIQEAVLRPSLGGSGEFRVPPIARVLMRMPVLRGLPARVMAYGVVRPRLRVPELSPKADRVPATSSGAGAAR